MRAAKKHRCQRYGILRGRWYWEPWEDWRIHGVFLFGIWLRLHLVEPGWAFDSLAWDFRDGRLYDYNDTQDSVPFSRCMLF